MSKEFSRDLPDGGDARRAAGRSRNGRESPDRRRRRSRRSSGFRPRKSTPSVARMNLRLGLGGGRAGLKRGKGLRDLARVGTRRYGCCWSEGRRPRSDLFDAPARSRLIVVSLLPKASKEGKRKVAASNGCSASAEMASSISTAFMSSKSLCLWAYRSRRFSRG